MKRRPLIAGLAAGAAAPLEAAAQAPPNPGAAANANVVGIISGGLDGTYTRFAADLAAVLDGVDGLRVLPILGKGSARTGLGLA